jgi:hypothetical protein
MHTTTTWVQHYMGVTLPLHVEHVFSQLWLLIWFNLLYLILTQNKNMLQLAIIYLPSLLEIFECLRDNLHVQTS